MFVLFTNWVTWSVQGNTEPDVFVRSKLARAMHRSEGFVFRMIDVKRSQKKSPKSRSYQLPYDVCTYISSVLSDSYNSISICCHKFDKLDNSKVIPV